MEADIDDLQSRLDATESRLATAESALGEMQTTLDQVSAEQAAGALRLDQIEQLLAGVTRVQVDGHDVLRLEAMNLQVVNGSGSTYGASNRLGNLIVGYHADTLGADRSGSHTLIVGDDHGYSADGGVLFGCRTASPPTAPPSPEGSSTPPTATVRRCRGGHRNHASGQWASVSGGADNQAAGEAASVTGGRYNTASATGSNASVTGGVDNTASGEHASVTGGRWNEASGSGASVTGGGSGNVANGNLAAGDYSSISGGARHVTAAPVTSTVGGFDTVNSGSHNTIVGGDGDHVRGNAVHVRSTGRDGARRGQPVARRPRRRPRWQRRTARHRRDRSIELLVSGRIETESQS